MEKKVQAEIQNIEHLIQVKDRFRKGRDLSFLKGREEKGKKKPITEKKREKEWKKGKNLLTLRIEIG